MFWVVYFHMASHTPTTIACCKRSDSGVQREVREREKMRRKRGGPMSRLRRLITLESGENPSSQ